MSLQSVQSLDMSQSLKNKKEKNKEKTKQKSCCYAFQILAHSSIRKYVKSHAEVLQNILTPGFSKSRSLALTKAFYILFLYCCVFSSGACCSWTDLSVPRDSPEQRGPSPCPQDCAGSSSPHNYTATSFPSRYS